MYLNQITIILKYWMAFDFFNEGLKPQPKIEFTKQEDDFLKAKLPFLDPKKTSQILIGTAIPLFNISKINSSNRKKIIQNCKIQDKKAITYEQMKRVFRGISLVQKGIQPSAININANIKLPMPKFYDDDDDDQDQPEQKPAPQIQKQKSPPKQTQVQQPATKPSANTKEATFAQFKQFEQFPQKTLPQPVKQSPPPQVSQPQVQPKQQSQKQPQVSQPSQSSNNKFAQFEAYWSKLNTHNNKIDGGQVKSLCKNLAQRSNLSKAWKICCQTHSGSLTKGQFYVFLQMVGLSQLPQGLSQEMKATISKIDKFIKDLPKEKPQPVPNQMGSTQIFQNFGKSELSMTSVQPTHKPTNQPPIVPKSSTNLAVTEMGKKISAKLQAQSKSLQAAQQANEQQLLQLRRQQQTMNNMMGQVEQFLVLVNNKNNKIKNQIDELKNNQLSLNQRFNKVCVAMNQIINRQNTFIQQLMNQMANQNAVNQQKMTVLQAYVVERNKHAEQVEENYRAHLQKSASNQRQPKSESIKDKKIIAQFQQQKEEPVNPINPFHQQDPQSPKNQPQVKEKNSPISQQQNPPNVRQSPKVEEHQQHPQPRSQVSQQGQISQQQLEYMNRMKMKQMQVIQLIHYLTPISPEEYPKIAQKITAYSEQQLNYAYTGLYEKLMQKRKIQQMMAQREKQKPADQFNSTNFKKEQQESQAQGEDFFS